VLYIVALHLNSLSSSRCALLFFWLVSRQSWSRFGHTIQRPRQIVCPNSDSVCPNSDKIYLTVVTSKFLLLFFAYWWEARLISPFRFVDCPLLASPETLSLKWHVSFCSNKTRSLSRKRRPGAVCVSIYLTVLHLVNYLTINQQFSHELSSTCRRRVADMSPTSPNAKCRQILADIACRCDTEEAPTYPIYINYYRQVQISPNIRVP